MCAERDGEEHGGALATRAATVFTLEKGKMVESSSPCTKTTKEVRSEAGMTRQSGGLEELEMGATDEGQRHEWSSVATMAMAALASFERRQECWRGGESERVSARETRRVRWRPLQPRLAVVMVPPPCMAATRCGWCDGVATVTRARARGRGRRGADGLASASGPKARHRPAKPPDPFLFF